MPYALGFIHAFTIFIRHSPEVHVWVGRVGERGNRHTKGTIVASPFHKGVTTLENMSGLGIRHMQRLVVVISEQQEES
jgi:hypothetical protein